MSIAFDTTSQHQPQHQPQMMAKDILNLLVEANCDTCLIERVEEIVKINPNEKFDMFLPDVDYEVEDLSSMHLKQSITVLTRPRAHSVSKAAKNAC